MRRYLTMLRQDDRRAWAAILLYINAHYEDINSALRGVNVDREFAHRRVDFLRQRDVDGAWEQRRLELVEGGGPKPWTTVMLEIADVLQAAIRNAPLVPADFWVFRGVTSQGILRRFRTTEVENVLKHVGVFSTSTSVETAKSYSFKRRFNQGHPGYGVAPYWENVPARCCIHEVLLPQVTPALYITGHYGESELLLPAGSKFLWDGQNHDRDGRLFEGLKYVGTD